MKYEEKKNKAKTKTFGRIFKEVEHFSHHLICEGFIKQLELQILMKVYGTIVDVLMIAFFDNWKFKSLKYKRKLIEEHWIL